MFCPNCQKEVSDTAKICGYCGTKLAQAESPPPPPQEEVSFEPETIEEVLIEQRPVEVVSHSLGEVYVPEPEPISKQEAVPPLPEPDLKISLPTVKTKKPLPKLAWWLIGLPIMIGMNLGFGYFYNVNDNVNISLDMLGTVVITVLLGPVAGLIAGISLCLIATFTYYEFSYYFIPIHMLFALGAWITHKNGWFESIWKTILSSLANNFIVQTVVTITVLLGFYAPADRTFETVMELLPNTLLNPVYLQLTAIYLLVWLGFHFFSTKTLK
jgi:energy-coupling factor transport system substrate-specific component